MHMASGTKSTSNLGYMHFMTAVSLEMSNEPIFGFEKLSIPRMILFFPTYANDYLKNAEIQETLYIFAG